MARDADELVAHYDAAGTVVGRVRRAEMRAHGLWHAATLVLVRSGDGSRVYVHRRAPDKDVFPGLHDCWAGGVFAAGETPEQGAERELAEELGVRGVPLAPLFTFEQPPVRCHYFAYEVRWDGLIAHQPEEIVSGRWMSLAGLRAWAEDPESPFVPDGRYAIREWFRRRGQGFPGQDLSSGAASPPHGGPGS
ncbi:NUDIX hydrolase [Amycolatopsis granulosa]|uniref:NUDIX hydrolase n=1 Tax=Amycolatopsis granulosa TaxID=185684 RepID=UPI001421E2DD|nr:NUDIX domain-containing protein [Amycolatopsis granulosa]NIH83552.1 8-oxo-dGTP pyrophosphatase MutT (NUDIX family) [Amycolatopsis granulosa]